MTHYSSISLSVFSRFFAPLLMSLINCRSIRVSATRSQGTERYNYHVRRRTPR